MCSQKVIQILFNFIIFFYQIVGEVVLRSPQVVTDSGVIRGQAIAVFGQTVHQYLGIPYAEPPLGDLRFAKPRPLNTCNKKYLDTTQHRTVCIQQPGPSFDISGSVTMSEDCLVLNVWSQGEGSLRPVLFFIHGGFLKTGSIFLSLYNGSALSTRDIVFVSANYRLGKLGFLYADHESAPGNVGFYDQLLALKWVRDNIHLFGGDKNRVTIVGQSAGSWGVSAHLLSPLSKGLFKQAIMQSGAILHHKDRPVLSKAEAVSEAKQLAERLNCSDKDWLKCLRSVDPMAIVEADKVNQRSYPVFGTEFLPLSTQEAMERNLFNHDLDVLAGLVLDEGSILAFASDPHFFSKSLTIDDFIAYAKRLNRIYHNLNIEAITEFYLKDVDRNDSNRIKNKLYDFYGDIVHNCPTYLFAKRYVEHSLLKNNVFFYEWNYKSKNTQVVNLVKSYLNVASNVHAHFGVFHGSELPFVFGLPPLTSDTVFKDEFELTNRVMQMWTDFVKHGTPDSDWMPMVNISEPNSFRVRVLPMQSKNYLDKPFADICDGIWKNYF